MMACTVCTMCCYQSLSQVAGSVEVLGHLDAENNINKRFIQNVYEVRIITKIIIMNKFVR